MKLFKKKSGNQEERWNFKTMFGPNMSFAAAEAYRLLRANIMFSFSDEGHCHVVGITSALTHEGKSSTACNTAYALSESGAKVLLLEADLRKPTVAAKLGLARVPGLTNLLVSKEDFREIVQRCTAAPGLDVLTSGDIPPNPSELLGSNRMARLIEELSMSYDYIIVDLPPVTLVSDAIAMSKFLHGVVVVVRGNVSERRALADALRQLELVNVRIIGFVYRVNGRVGKSYGKYGKYGKYYARKDKTSEKKTTANT